MRKVGGLVLAASRLLVELDSNEDSTGGFLGDSVVKNLTASARDVSSVPHPGGFHMLWSS